MNTIKYQAFLEAVDSGSLTQVAKKLNYSQPAITHMIHSLEEKYGFSLLIRGTDKVTPTESALQLLPYLRSIVYNEKSLNEEVDKINNVESGHINLGTYNSVMQSFLPKLIQLFLSKHPTIGIDLVEGNRVELDKYMRKRQADFAVVSEFDYPEYDFLPLYEDEMMAVVPIGHPLAERKSVTPDELFQYPVVAVESESDMDFREVCRIHDLHPTVRMRAKQEISLLQLINHDIGVGIIPSLYLFRKDLDVAVLKLDSPYKKRDLGIAMISKEELSPACKEFVRISAEEYGKSFRV